MLELLFLLVPFGGPYFIGIFAIMWIYWKVTRNYNFWKKQGIPFVKPVPFFGSSLDTLNKPLHEVLLKRYKELGPVYGFFDLSTPILSVGDPVLLRDIMVKDFPSFTGRRSYTPGNSIVEKALITLQGEDWKRVRSIITPTFSTGKIKRMLGIFQECSETLAQNFRNSLKERKSVDVRRFYGAFTMDVIASAAFSTKLDSHNDPENKFVKNARLAFSQTKWLKVLRLFPLLLKYLNFFMIRPVSKRGEFFRRVTVEMIEERQRTGQVRNDFLQLLIDTTEEVSDEQKWDENEKGDIASNYAESNAGHQIFKTVVSKNLSRDELVAQSVTFFLVGYHTTAMTLSFATYLLALNQEVQEKLYEEVNHALKVHEGNLSHEAIQSMKYLDNVISETLRMYPPAATIERLADCEYKLRKTGITIEKGMSISIPIFSIHHDPKYYPDPEKFNPDRFTPEERAKRDSFTYIPFGAGPRNCIGMRFVLLEMKTCLAYVISNFKIKRSSNTVIPLEFGVAVQGLLQPKGITVDMEIRENSPFLK